MVKFPKFSLLFLAWLPLHTATAADFAIKDLSGEQDCLADAFFVGLRQTFPTIAQCAAHPVGTVEVLITPEPGELPIKCHEFDGRRFCMYAGDIYIAAHYQGQWFAKTGYTWTPVDLTQLQPRKQWVPWSGVGSMADIIYVASIDLNTSKYVPPPEGFEVYIGIAPPGGPSFTARTVAKIYPVPRPE